MSFDKSDHHKDGGRVPKSAAKLAPKPLTEDYDLYRKTFLSFIDLMMVREATMTAYAIRKGTTNLTT